MVLLLNYLKNFYHNFQFQLEVENFDIKISLFAFLRFLF